MSSAVFKISFQSDYRMAESRRKSITNMISHAAMDMKRYKTKHFINYVAEQTMEPPYIWELAVEAKEFTSTYPLSVWAEGVAGVVRQRLGAILDVKVACAGEWLEP